MSMSCILYGSQTGQAKCMAETVFNNMSTLLNIRLFELDELEKSYDLYAIKTVVIICSTTGDGDAPENASRFLRLLKLSDTALSHLNYTVLGLGDTNYSNFCRCGKLIDTNLARLGAKRFYPSAWADDAVGMEMVVEPWLEGLYLSLVSLKSEQGSNQCELVSSLVQLRLSEICVPIPLPAVSSTVSLLGDELATELANMSLTVPPLSSAFLDIVYEEATSDKVNCSLPIEVAAALPAAQTPLTIGRLQAVRRITQKFAVKPVHLVTVVAEEEPKWKWNAGDSISVLPRNSQREVDDILVRLGVPEAQRDCPMELRLLPAPPGRRAPKLPGHLDVTSPRPVSVRSVLQWLVDLRAPLTKPGLRIMAEHAVAGSAARQRLMQLCAKEGQSLYTRCMREPSMAVLDLLNWFPDCQLPLSRLLEVLPRLKPRSYSLCDLDSLSFAFSKVDIAPVAQFRRRPLTGVCTTWLENVASRDLEVEPVIRIPMYMRKNLNGFCISTEHTNKPHILIGPGTGVAPFIGFLQHFERLRSSGMDIGSVWLFHGCRHEARDFLFREQLEGFLSRGMLAHLCVCFSRDTSKNGSSSSLCVPVDCHYVQDCVRHHATELAPLLVDAGARVFVCGDAGSMVKDVQQAMCRVVQGHNETLVTEHMAEAFVTGLRVNKVYMEDVWA